MHDLSAEQNLHYFYYTSTPIELQATLLLRMIYKHLKIKEEKHAYNVIIYIHVLAFEGPSFLARKLPKSLCFSNSLIIGKHKFNFKRIIKRLYYYCPVINM